MSTQDWPAPVAAAPVDATVTLPGSKSLTNRYLVLAALAEGPSRLGSPLRSRDTQLMAQALRTLGTHITDGPDGDWLVEPGPLSGPAAVDVGLAGTVMRFLPAVAALADGDVVFDGDARARERPMGPIVTALRDLGVDVAGEHLDARGDVRMPFTVRGTGSVKGGIVRIDASASSQFVSALLLAAARYGEGVVVEHVGAPIPSEPHVAMTVEVLRDVGVQVDVGPSRWQVHPGRMGALDVQVEPDLSNAAAFLGAATVTGGRVTVTGWPEQTTQAGDGVRDLLDEMGADVSFDRDGLVVRGSGDVYGIDADLHDVGELTPVVAALAALAEGPSQLRGIAHLRGHEADRLAALATELNALGGDVTETEDGLIIRPRPLHGGVFHTYDDHRLVMAGALLGLKVHGVVVENVGTVGKTLPEFVPLWTGMLGA